MSSNFKMGYENSAANIEDFIKSLDINASDNLDLAKGSSFNISVAQLAFREHTSLEDYIREMNFVVSQGVNQRAHLVCFPAFTGFLPASLFPQYKTVLSSLKLDPITKLPQSVWIYKAVSALASDCLGVYTATMSGLAQAYNIYIMAGTMIYPENGGFKHRALLYGPDGNIAGVQDKIVAGELERDLHIESADEIRVFPTPMGNIAIMLTDDTKFFEIAAIAKKLGVNVFLNPTAFIAPYIGADEAEGLNLRVQECSAFGVQSVMIGEIPMGFTLGGYSGIYGPIKLSKDNSKTLMYHKTIKHNQTQVLSARLSQDDLDGKADPLYSDTNPEFKKRYIDHLY